MLVQIGKRSTQGDDVLDALAACHQRIRLYVNLAREVAASTDARADERCAAARAVRRYFTLGLPLHVADEDELIAPLLVGRSPYVDEALRMMHDEHETHAAGINRLILLCHVIEHDPRHPRALAELARLVERLDAELQRHLALEESIIFPALRRCSPWERAALHAAMQYRRQVPRATSTTAAK